MEKKTAEHRIGKQVLTEDDLKIEVPYKDELFVMKYPTPWEKAQIERVIAGHLNGMPRASFPEGELFRIQAMCYVDGLMIPDLCPDWFVNPWQCYDEQLVLELFSGYLSFRDEFVKNVNNGRYRKGSTG
jgi:hypothetical protein